MGPMERHAPAHQPDRPALSATQIGELTAIARLNCSPLACRAHFRHDQPQSNGPALYVALIATLLTAMATGRRPSKVALAILQFVAAGLTELEQMLPTLERFERERELARLRREKRRAALRAPQ